MTARHHRIRDKPRNSERLRGERRRGRDERQGGRRAATRLPPATKAALKAHALQQSAPLSKMVEQAVTTLQAAERRLLTDLAKSIERR